MVANNVSDKLFRIMEWVLLALFLVFIMIPFIMIVLTSFKTPLEITDIPNRTLFHRIFPDSFLNFRNLKDVFWGTASQLNGIPFYRFIINSLIVTFFSLLPALFLGLTSGFGFAKYDFPGKGIIFYMFLGLIMVPMEMISIPLYMVVNKLHLTNTYVGMMIPGCMSAFGTFLLKESIENIPDSYMEAGRIDGASELWIFFHIIIPLITGPIVTFIVIKCTWSWNEFFWPMLIVSTEKMKTVTLGMSKFSNDLFREYSQICAAVLLSIIPLLLMFIFGNKHVKVGLMSSGIKG